MMVAVMLGDMNENEFREFCAKVLKWLGYREVEVVYGRPDFWGDIRLVSPKGEKVMVLCVHRLGRDVERDEIYGFCEALLNSSYDKGIIICTGRLSRDALKVIDSLNGGVEVWGLPRFREVANEVGVKLGEMTYDTEDVALPAMTKDKIIEYVVSELLNIKGFTYMGDAGFDVEIDIEYMPVYRIEYRLMRSSLGERVVVKKWEGFQIVYIDGRDGDHLPHLNIFDDMPFEPLRRAESHKIHDFTLTAEQAVERVYGIFGGRYAGTGSREVQGPEGFNVTKVSTYRPGIEITSVTKVFLSIFKINVRILDKAYFITCYTKPPNHVYMILNNLTHCKKCHKDLPSKELAVCNKCGEVLHYRIIERFKHTCWKCLKIVCEECATTRRKWVMIPVRYCRTCSQEEGKNEGKRKQHQMYEETPMALSKPTPSNNAPSINDNMKK
jgi:hypothetical protein